MDGRSIRWVGDSKKRPLEFPKEVRVRIGHALSEAQSGRKTSYAKPMKGLGAGVLEIVADHDGDAYRAVYALQIDDDVYVIHAFQKKSTTGISTPKHEIDLIKQRLKMVRSNHESKK